MATQYTQRGIGFFAEEAQAEQAVRSLEAANFPMDQVSIVAKQLKQDTVAGGAKTGSQVKGQDINAPKRRPEQAVTAAFWGGLVGGLSSIAFPGAGAVLATGAVGTALATAVAGQGAGAAVSFKLEQGLASLGVSDQQAKAFSDRLIQGDYMVIVDSNAEAITQAESVLKDQQVQAWNVHPIPDAA